AAAHPAGLFAGALELLAIPAPTRAPETVAKPAAFLQGGEGCGATVEIRGVQRHPCRLPWRAVAHYPEADAFVVGAAPAGRGDQQAMRVQALDVQRWGIPVILLHAGAF